MEVNVTVTVELGPKTIALLTGGLEMPASAKPVKEVAKSEPAKEEVAEKPKATRTRTTSKAKAKEEAPDFGELDEDAQLEAIKAEVTRHTKKGKSADIKALLAHFDAGRASELAPEVYPGFFDAIKRYGAGESVDDITSLD